MQIKHIAVAAITTCLACGLTAPRAHAQGAVILKNFGSGSNGTITPIAYVFDSPGTKAGSNYFVQLYAGPAGTYEGSLRAVGSPLAMLGNGLFGSPNVIIPGVAIGETAALQVRAWAAAAGATFEDACAAGGNTGRSSILQIMLGDAGSTTPNSVPALVGLQPMLAYLVPEPSTAVLGLCGGVLMLAARCRSRVAQAEAIFPDHRQDS